MVVMMHLEEHGQEHGQEAGDCEVKEILDGEVDRELMDSQDEKDAWGVEEI